MPGTPADMQPDLNACSAPAVGHILIVMGTGKDKLRMHITCLIVRNSRRLQLKLGGSPGMGSPRGYCIGAMLVSATGLQESSLLSVGEHSGLPWGGLPGGGLRGRQLSAGIAWGR